MTLAKRALILGRFQPPHKGHLQVIEDAAPDYEELLIVIGSAQAKSEPENPFTADERQQMLEAALEDAGVTNTRIVALADLNDHENWAAYVAEQVPVFDHVLTRNPVTKTLFSSAGYHIVETPLHDRERYNGTLIRRLLAEGHDVADYVPPAVDAMLKELGATKRIQEALEESDD